MANEHTPSPFDLHTALVDALPAHQIEVQGWFDTEENQPRWSATVGKAYVQHALARVGIGPGSKPLHSRSDALRAAARERLDAAEEPVLPASFATPCADCGAPRGAVQRPPADPGPPQGAHHPRR